MYITVNTAAMKNLFLGTFVFFSYQYIFTQHYFQPIVKVEGNCINGYARIEYKNGEVYLGHCKDSLPDGQGNQYIMHGWLDKVTMTYIGTFKKGQRHGKGTITYDDGDSYTGGWKNGLWHGKGMYLRSDSSYFKGTYKEDFATGYGINKLSSGDLYKGMFKWGKRNGFGVYTGVKGERYVGYFKDDKFNGMGKFTIPDGSSYKGHYKNNRFHGLGTLTKPDSLPQKGVWKNSKFLGTSHALLDSIKEPDYKNMVRQNYVYYKYLAVIVNFRAGFEDTDWSSDDYIIYSDLAESYADHNIIVTDTFYYTIDTDCYFNGPEYRNHASLETFYDYVQTDSMVTFKNDDEDGFYWQTHVEVLRNNYHYNSGIGIFDEILRFLVDKSIEQLEPKAIDIYNYHWPPEAHE